MSLNMLGMSMGYGECVQQVGRKIRKPYTISKCRESWTEQEHDKFCEALQLFDRDWKKIEAFVGSKTIIQIRSHAQKYFLKVQKNGTGEHVPPPRPKRKSSQPYPQKAPKFALFGQQVQRGGATAFCCDSLFSFRPQSSTLSAPPVSSPSVSSWVHHTVPQSTVSSVSNGVCVSDFKSEREISGRDDNSDSGRSSWSGFLQQSNPAVQGNHEMFRVMPDFAEVYSFIGSVFDPNASGHLKKLKGMTPIDRETILLLMRNLSANLTSPDLLEHLTFLSLHDTCSKDPRPSVKNINAGINIPCVVPQPLSA